MTSTPLQILQRGVFIKPLSPTNPGIDDKITVGFLENKRGEALEKWLLRTHWLSPGIKQPLSKLRGCGLFTYPD